jgi:hypothetical protein
MVFDRLTLVNRVIRADIVAVPEGVNSFTRGPLAILLMFLPAAWHI